HLIDPEANSYEQYWQKDASARESADAFVRKLQFDGHYRPSATGLSYQDERHQPPLYYLLAAPVFAVLSRYFYFTEMFFILRLWSVLVASLVIPGSFLLARTIFKEPREYHTTVALIVLFPGLYPAVTRISNDALAVPIA